MLTYEELADKITKRVIKEVIYLYREPGLLYSDGELMDEEDYEDIYDIVFGELVDQHEAE